MSQRALTDDELIALTGYVRGSDQLRYLRDQGLNPFPGRDGHPRITWEAINARMAGNGDKPDAGDLDWSVLQRGHNANRGTQTPSR